jgi:N utilization substance protein B
VRRRDQRQAAVFALYQQEVTGRDLGDLFDPTTRPFSMALAHAVEDNREELDELIERHSKGWALNRIAPLERSILRVALLEMLHPELVADKEPIPAEGAIEEAVETAKTFCGEDAPGFVNGVLGAALVQVRENPGPS